MVSFCEWLLPEIFRASMRALNRTTDDKAWLTDRQLDDLRDQIVRQLGIGREQEKMIQGCSLQTHCWDLLRFWTLSYTGADESPTARVQRDPRRPRVARAQATHRAISSHLTAHSPPCYDAIRMNTHSESGKTNLVAIGVLVGVAITGVWVWKRLSLDIQEYVIDQAIPMAFAGLVIVAALWMLVRVFIRRREQRGERAKLMAAFKRATVQEKKLEIAFALIEVNGYRAEGLESVTPALRDLFTTTLQQALDDKQHRIRGMAASYLGVLNDKTVIPLLLVALEDEHAYVRSCAALGLGRLRASEAKEKLTTAMEEDWDQTVRSRSKEALERIKQS